MSRSNVPSQPRPEVPAVDVIEVRVARRVIAAHRSRLDWLLKVPQWQELFDDSVHELGLPARRQGIGREAALLALPLEHKYEVVRRAVPRYRRHLTSMIAQGICRMMGIERFSRLDLDDVLTARQWNQLRSAFILRLAQEHRRYKRAQQLLFTGFAYTIEAAAARLAVRSCQKPDCAQEGALGLLAAIDRADDSDHDFGAYATAWVRRRIRNHLMREKLPVHAPVNLISQAARAGRTEEPNAKTVSRTESLLLECLRSPSVSFDQPADTGDDAMGDSVADPCAHSPADAAGRADLACVVTRHLEELTSKQREVLMHRYGLGGAAIRSLTETARAVGISHQQVGMRERRALQRLERSLQPVWAELECETNI